MLSAHISNTFIDSQLTDYIVNFGPGQICGRKSGVYTILQQLGKGGLGIVYKAVRESDGLTVALKMTHQHSPAAALLIKREARILSLLQHPNIAKFLALDTTLDGEPFMVMEFMPGQTLQELLLAEGKLDTCRAANICRQIALAMEYAHRQGIVHRDLKPGNIMISWRNGIETVTLLDFGISKGSDDENVPLDSGSILYLAPEQLLGKRSLACSDVYQLGLIWYECLTGHLPFESHMDAAIMYRLSGKMSLKYRQAFKQIPADCNCLLSIILEKNPRLRMGSMRAFATALDVILAGYYKNPPKAI